MRSRYLIGLVAAGMILIGCEKKEEAPKPSSSGGIPQAAGEAAAEAREKMAGAADQAKEMGTTAVAEAQKMIDQVKQYIEEKKLNDADAVLQKLENMRASLPQNIQKMIDECKTMLEKAKAAMK